MRVSLLTLTFCIVFSFWGVSKAEAGNDTLFSRHRLQLLFGNGVMLNKATLVNGEHVPETAISFSHSLHCNYQWVLSRRFSLTAGYALGIQAFSSYVAPFGEETGSRTVLFADHADYFGYHQLTAEAAFRFKTGRNDMMSLFAGGGAQRLRSGTFGGTSHVGDFEQSRIYLKIEGNWFPFATAGGEYFHALKNSDQLSVRLFYQHSFRNWYQGTYYIYEGTSSGDLHASGSRISLGVGYVFTGIGRARKLNALEAESGDRKLARKALRNLNRRVDPRARFFAVGGGMAIPQTVFSDPNRIFMRNMWPTRSLMVHYEYGFRDNFFFEAGYLTNGYIASFNPHKDLIFRSGFWVLNLHTISLGGGYRVCTVENVPLLNFHAGLMTGIHLSKNGEPFEFSDNISYGRPDYSDTLTISGKITVGSNIGLGFYAALSKDFRVSNRLALSVMGRYQWGLIRQFEYSLDYHDSGKGGLPGFDGHADGGFSNSCYYAVIALKYKL